MNGFWFAAMVACLMLAGVAVQLGWQPPPMLGPLRLHVHRRAAGADEIPDIQAGPST
jgi:hypothetical protein